MSNRPEDQNHLLPPSGLSSSPVRKVPKDYNFPRSVCDLVGRTPLLELARVGNGSRLLIKLECFNPTGSAKIRMALAMVRSAERRGQIKPGYTIVELTSGNTGLGLALAAAQLGYKFIGVVDSHAAPWKLAAMKAYGAELIVVDGPSDRPSTMLRRKKAEEICSSSPYVWWPDQHNNPNNPLGYSHLAEELDSAISASIDVLVASVGTGGTLCGTARRLRELGHSLTTIGVEPEGSIIFGPPAGSYKQSGAGAPGGFPVGCNVDTEAIDQGLKINDVKAFATCRVLAREKGLMLGGTSGAAIYEALRQLPSFPAGTTMVVIACDAGEKYQNTIFDDRWMIANKLLSDIAEHQVSGMLRAFDDSIALSNRQTANLSRYWFTAEGASARGL
ncbi:PLP-dependent cysteine synthase family protein [Corynebacterium kroppenstedtii]|uniref:PLP-dependent cysteine synthase family protein n=1 Tax=Corynebacterium kroppenstedtii TaxID=161879 RepID=UPI003872A9A6